MASRFVLQQFVFNSVSPEKRRQIFQDQVSIIRRALFSRSLRLLPLPEQVGAVEAVAVLIDQVPDIIPLSDQHLLAFLSELLKMSSIADGEMSGEMSVGGSVVDKNGFVVPSRNNDSSSNSDTNQASVGSHASAIFLRRGCVLHMTDGAKFVLPEEAPNGVLLRCSSICLLRAVIRAHPDHFFDAESTTPIGEKSYR